MKWMGLPFVSTMNFIPLHQKEWVGRPRLMTRLDEVLAPGQKLVLVSAPPGYVKTTLVSDWRANRQNTCQPGGNLRVSWLSLEAARFFLYLVRSIHATLPVFSKAELAAPHALLDKIRDLGLTLISVTKIEEPPDQKVV